MKDFDSWNELKKKIEDDKNDPDKFPKEGEVWMCSLGRNIGFEQNGSGDNFSRPILIIKKIKIFPLEPRNPAFGGFSRSLSALCILSVLHYASKVKLKFFCKPPTSEHAFLVELVLLDQSLFQTHSLVQVAQVLP